MRGFRRWPGKNHAGRIYGAGEQLWPQAAGRSPIDRFGNEAVIGGGAPAQTA
jgi:hypothetical protein